MARPDKSYGDVALLVASANSPSWKAKVRERRAMQGTTHRNGSD
jgi:hypothetical protein